MTRAKDYAPTRAFEGAEEGGNTRFATYWDWRARLSALASEVVRDLERQDYPNLDWVLPATLPNGEQIHDVVIVGAGQGGLAVALALWRERVRCVLVIDKAAKGEEGPWVTFARMQTLRTPKYLTGPDAGIAPLTFRAWFETKYLEPDWGSLVRIPRKIWMDYLLWFRDTAPVTVWNETELVEIRPDKSGCLRLACRRQGGDIAIYARRIVLANGLEGSGGWYTPRHLSDPLDSGRFIHSADRYDFSRLAGKRVGILGAGASAVDCAATAMESGAASCDLFFRRTAISGGERRRWAENAGFLRHFHELDPPRKWRTLYPHFAAGTPAPRWSLERLSNYPAARIHPGEAWQSTRMAGSDVEVVTPKGRYRFDFIVFGTGICVDLDLRPELAAFAGQIATWGDRYIPPPELADPVMARYPWLGPGGQLIARDPDRTPELVPFLDRIHIFNWGATLSMGISSASITGMKFGMERIVRGITRGIYEEQVEAHIASFPG